MKMSTRSLYAVMALVELALRKDETLVSLPDIAEQQGLSLAYLEQIFMTLRQNGLVKSLRGQKGGYILTKQASDISVASILRAMGEMPRVTRCQRKREETGEGSPGCLPNGAQCLTHHVWAKLEVHIETYLRSVSLEDICMAAQATLPLTLRKEAACL